MQKYLSTILAALLALAVLPSCSDEETYADQKKREDQIIESFLNANTVISSGDELLCHVGKITVISEDRFLKDTVTRCEYDTINCRYIHNEYVQLNTGIYMQIVRRGVGEVLPPGQSKQLVARYFEYNMSKGSIATRNTFNNYHRYPDILDVSNSYGTITGSFNTTVCGGGAMYRTYGTTTVPEGWLTPLRFVKVGYQKGSEGIAKVRLIVPHQLGHSTATASVHPYFYEITYSVYH